MRTVTITKAQFDDFVFSAIASGAAEDEAELEVAVRVFKKLNANSLPRPFTDEEQLEIKQGRKLRAQRDLRDNICGFIFEEDEYNLVLKRLISYLRNIALVAAEEYYELLSSVKAAVKE